MLRGQGFEVREFCGEAWRPELGDVLLVRGNLNWYPLVKRQLFLTPRDRLPPVVIWHIEPLPPPAARVKPGPGWITGRSSRS
jgi:hypothetical protein